jgi:hypothetical protein
MHNRAHQNPGDFGFITIATANLLATVLILSSFSGIFRSKYPLPIDEALPRMPLVA